MDPRTPLVAQALQRRASLLPRSQTAFAAGAGMGAVSLAAVSVVASYWHDDGRLPFYAAEAVCATGLCVSLAKLQTVTNATRRIAHAQSMPVPHFSLVLDQQEVNQLTATMTGLSGLLGTAAIGIGAIGAAVKLPTSNNIAAVSVGLFNLAVATAHFYKQVHETAPSAAAEAPTGAARGMDAAAAPVQSQPPVDIATALASVV